MSIIFNNEEVEEFIFNDVDCEKVYFNGELVFEKSTAPAPTHTLTVGSVRYANGWNYGLDWQTGHITPATAFGGAVERLLWNQGPGTQYGRFSLTIANGDRDYYRITIGDAVIVVRNDGGLDLEEGVFELLPKSGVHPITIEIVYD